MESVLTAAISLFILLYGMLTLSYASFNAQDNLQATQREMAARLNDQVRTDLSLVDVEVVDEGSTVQVTLRNEGETRLFNYEQWDAIIHYYDGSAQYFINWLPYQESATAFTNEWAVAGIYVDAEAAALEEYEPGILNPGEEIVLQLGVSPAVGVDTTNMLVISTENGTCSTAMFSN